MTNITMSAHDFTNDIAMLRDHLRDNDDIIPDIIPGELSDIFARLDPDLAALYKDMKTAALNLSQAKKDTHMIDILKWQYESAQSAYQTRLLEVRGSKLLKAKLSHDEEAEVKRLLHQKTMQETMNEQFTSLRRRQMQEKKKREEKESGGWFFYFMLGVWLASVAKNQFNNHKRDYSSARHAFSMVRTAS